MKRLITLAAIAATLVITATCASAETVEPEVNYDDQMVLISATDESTPVVDSTVEVTDTVTSEAEVITVAPATMEADDKGSPDTGVEGVATFAGIAVLAAGAIILTRKK